MKGTTITARERALSVAGRIIVETLEQEGLKIVFKHEHEFLKFAARNNPDKINDALDAMQFSISKAAALRIEKKVKELRAEGEDI